MYEKQINSFKAEIARKYKINDCSRPVKGSKNVSIVIYGRENNQAVVQLSFSQQFRRIFGQYNFAHEIVFEGELKEACEAARVLKEETGLPIKYHEYEEEEWF